MNVIAGRWLAFGDDKQRRWTQDVPEIEFLKNVRHVSFWLNLKIVLYRFFAFVSMPLLDVLLLFVDTLVAFVDFTLTLTMIAKQFSFPSALLGWLECTM